MLLRNLEFVDGTQLLALDSHIHSLQSTHVLLTLYSLLPNGIYVLLCLSSTSLILILVQDSRMTPWHSVMTCSLTKMLERWIDLLAFTLGSGILSLSHVVLPLPSVTRGLVKRPEVHSSL